MNPQYISQQLTESTQAAAATTKHTSLTGNLPARNRWPCTRIDISSWSTFLLAPARPAGAVDASWRKLYASRRASSPSPSPSSSSSFGPELPPASGCMQLHMGTHQRQGMIVERQSARCRNPMALGAASAFRENVQFMRLLCCAVLHGSSKLYTSYWILHLLASLCPSSHPLFALASSLSRRIPSRQSSRLRAPHFPSPLRCAALCCHPVPTADRGRTSNLAGGEADTCT